MQLHSLASLDALLSDAAGGSGQPWRQLLAAQLQAGPTGGLSRQQDQLQVPPATSPGPPHHAWQAAQAAAEAAQAGGSTGEGATPLLFRRPAIWQTQCATGLWAAASLCARPAYLHPSKQDAPKCACGCNPNPRVVVVPGQQCSRSVVPCSLCEQSRRLLLCEQYRLLLSSMPMPRTAPWSQGRMLEGYELPCVCRQRNGGAGSIVSFKGDRRERRGAAQPAGQAAQLEGCLDGGQPAAGSLARQLQGQVISLQTSRGLALAAFLICPRTLLLHCPSVPLHEAEWWCSADLRVKESGKVGEPTRTYMACSKQVGREGTEGWQCGQQKCGRRRSTPLSGEGPCHWRAGAL